MCIRDRPWLPEELAYVWAKRAKTELDESGASDLSGLNIDLDNLDTRAAYKFGRARAYFRAGFELSSACRNEEKRINTEFVLAEKRLNQILDRLWQREILLALFAFLLGGFVVWRLGL